MVFLPIFFSGINPKTTINIILLQEIKFENTKCVIRTHKSKKDRQPKEKGQNGKQ